MATLVDTSVLLDVLFEGAKHGEESARRLARALEAGPVVINDIIAAELAPTFDDEQLLWSTLGEAQIRLDPYPRPAVYAAGRGV